MRRTAMIRTALRSLLYPGLDLHTRNRASLCRYWRRGPRRVLDAGCGNGYFSWLAYRSGATVVAINHDALQVRKAENLLFGYRGADPKRLRFRLGNLYELGDDEGGYDEIICYEVLEHLRRDHEMVRAFWRLLKPGGALHLCCPNRLHSRHLAEVLDMEERGGHVRPGYTIADYHTLLEPAGFQIDVTAGIGPRALYLADAVLRSIRNRFGDFAAIPFLPCALPFVWLAQMNPATPFSVYCRALKVGGGKAA